jgi:hypothetical protein
MVVVKSNGEVCVINYGPLREDVKGSRGEWSASWPSRFLPGDPSPFLWI